MSDRLQRPLSHRDQCPSQRRTEQQVVQGTNKRCCFLRVLEQNISQHTPSTAPRLATSPVHLFSHPLLSPAAHTQRTPRTSFATQKRPPGKSAPPPWNRAQRQRRPRQPAGPQLPPPTTLPSLRQPYARTCAPETMPSASSVQRVHGTPCS